MADLGYGRGWAADDAAASIHRIDQQLGHPVQITEAGRSAEDADKNYAAWIAYQNGGPWAPYALPASKSVHCRGEAVDSNEHSAPWEANGWVQTARYDDDRDEPWHREYFPDRDQHINDPQEDDMPLDQNRDYPAFAAMLQRSLRFDVRPNGVGADWKLGPTLWERLNQLQAAQAGVTIDPKQLADAVADAIPDELAEAVVTALSKRLNPNG